MMIQVDIIKEKNELNMLKQEWNALVENSIKNSVFLQYSWITSITNSYDPSILIIIAKEDNKIKGILPLQITKDHNLEFITCDTTTINDFIYNNSYEIIEAILDKVFALKWWKTLFLTKIPQDSQSIVHLKEYLTKKRINFRVSELKCPQLKIDKSWEDFKASKTERFRKMIRYISNKAEKLGVNVELNKENKECLFEDFLEVSSDSWLAKEGHTLINEEQKKELYRQLFEIASKNKWLYAWILRKGNEPIAVEFDLKFNNELYALMSAYKEKYKSNSPGTYLHSQIVKHCFDNGFKLYDMGPGLNQYKIGWTENLRSLNEFQIFNNGMKSKIKYRFIHLKGFLKNKIKWIIKN